MLIIDTVALSDARTTADGYLVADAKIARTGIQTYSGTEMGRPDLAAVRVWRPADEVFHGDAMASMAHRPVTLEHPDEAITAVNWRRHSVGQTGGDVVRDGDFVRVPLVLMDQGAIEAVRLGKRQLSVGYAAEIDWTPGVTADGQSYDAVQRQIRGNHLAIVDQARAGPACRIGDVSATSVRVADPAAEIATLRAAIETRDGQIVALTASLQAAALTPAQLDRAVAARAKLIGDARRICNDDLAVEGRGEAEIRRAAVASRIGDATAAEMTDAGIDGAFRVLAAALPLRTPQAMHLDPVRRALAEGTPAGDPRMEALRRRDARLAQAWRAEGINQP